MDPGALIAHADKIDELRDKLAPSALPMGFEPAGADAVSAAAATNISAQAAEAANGLWSVWTALGRISGGLRANATNYRSQEELSAAALAGSGSATRVPSVSPVDVVAPPPAVPHVYTSPSAVTPEQLSQLLRSGSGESSPTDFGQAWRTHAAGVDDVIVDLGSTRAALSGSWSGPAAHGADSDLGAAHSDLMSQHDRVAEVGETASAHAGVYRTTVGSTPTPAQFADWHQQLDSAVSADSQYPGVYTSAVLAAQQQLNDGYTQTGSAYGQYAVDPTTGQLIDPASGLPIDPATGLPIADDADDDASDGQKTLEMGAQMLTGLLGGVMGAAGGAVSAATQGMQQLAQMATRGVGELAKSVTQGDQSGPDGLGEGSGGMGEFGGGSGGGSGGGEGGAMTPAAATITGSAPQAPNAATTTAPAAVPRAAPPEGGAGMAGMPMMPMGGAGGAGGGAKAAPGSSAKRFVPPERPNTARVIGATDTERVAAKRDRRQQQLLAAKAAGEGKEDASE